MFWFWSASGGEAAPGPSKNGASKSALTAGGETLPATHTDQLASDLRSFGEDHPPRPVSPDAAHDHAIIPIHSTHHKGVQPSEEVIRERDSFEYDRTLVHDEGRPIGAAAGRPPAATPDLRVETTVVTTVGEEEPKPADDASPSPPPAEAAPDQHVVQSDSTTVTVVENTPVTPMDAPQGKRNFFFSKFFFYISKTSQK